MSHELRTPLNAILGFAQLMEIDRTLSPRHTRFVGETLKAGAHLLALINEVLQLSQIEAGFVTLNPEAVDLDTLVDDCIGMMEPAASKRQVTLHRSRASGLVVQADHMRLRQVLLNLLSNAVKYNRDGGTVQIAMSTPVTGRLRLSVIDTGLGILPERQSELFQPFSRLGAEYGLVEGAGIGLSIVRKLVEMMGGTLGVDSEPGRGSHFWVELSSATAALAKPRAEPPGQADLSDERSGELTVLYIEDNLANRMLVAEIVARHPKVRLQMALTAGEGLALAHSQRFDLLLIDLQLPDMDGHAVLRQLHGHTSTRDISAVAVTAFALDSDRARTQQAGFAWHTAKPIDIAEFDAMLERFLPLNSTSTALQSERVER